MSFRHTISWLAVALLFIRAADARMHKIDRHAVVSHYNPARNASSTTTPMQVGNGNFAFGADVTGLQTFQPFAIMSSWGWKNDSLPPGRILNDMLTYKGTSLDNHGRNVTYMYDGVADIQQWLISNPNRVNLGRVGLLFLDSSGDVLNVTESDLGNKTQKLDLWAGEIISEFTFNSTKVSVKTICAQDVDVVGVQVVSSLVSEGKLGLFLDFPWSDGSVKFSAPFVGRFNATSNHTTSLIQASSLPKGAQAGVLHTIVNNSFVTTVGGSKFNISRDSPETHRYSINPAKGSSEISLSISYALQSPDYVPDFKTVRQSSLKGWESFWTDGGFIDVYTGSTDPRADELQRRIILSSYLMRVNEAGDYPPQEVGYLSVLLALPSENVHSVWTCKQWVGR